MASADDLRQTTRLSALRVAAAPTAKQGLALDHQARIPVAVAAQSIPVLTADPDAPKVGQVWYRSDTKALSVRHDATTTVRVTLA